jgi:Tol biopolymer transport system component
MVAFGSIAWSPDGKLLAYLSIDNQWSPEGNMVRVIPAEGGQSRAVTKLQRGFEVNVELAWSPDSRRIALNDGTIKIISLDDGQVVDVDPGVKTTRLYHLDWSRDGEKLVFAGQQGGGPEFWLIGDFLPTGTGAKDLK